MIASITYKLINSILVKAESYKNQAMFDSAPSIFSPPSFIKPFPFLPATYV